VSLFFITFVLILRTAKAPEGNREILNGLVFGSFGRVFFLLTSSNLKAVGVFVLVNLFLVFFSILDF